MKAVAIYNMKGGVGKTTAAVNLSYLAAAAGRRTLLWDLDPQAAATYAFRVRPRVPGFSKKSLEDGQILGAAIKETDFQNLHLLPADFAYRKFERYLDSYGKSERLIAALLDTLGRDFDIVFLDCPAGFSLVIEGVLAAADALLVPVVPTVLSLRTVARVIKWADRSEAQTKLAAFLSMVDRRKTLHRRATELAATRPELFLSGQIPYASVVEQMAVRRMPLPAFAGRDAATAAFAGIWAELEARLRPDRDERAGAKGRWAPLLEEVESMIDRLDSAEQQMSKTAGDTPTVDKRASAWGDRLAAVGDSFAHRFDTESRDIERSGHVLELRESNGNLVVVAMRSGDDADPVKRAQVQIDSSWALRILSGELSPLAALEQRLGRPGPPVAEDIRTIVGGRTLRRIDTRVAQQWGVATAERRHSHADAASTPARPVLVHTVRRIEAEAQRRPAVERDQAASSH